MNATEDLHPPVSLYSAQEYFEYLEELREIVSQLPSPPPSPPHHTQSGYLGDEIGADSSVPTHISLQKQIQEAYDAAQGDPADGRWALLSALLRMPSTSGRYRWIGLRSEGDVPGAVEQADEIDILPTVAVYDSIGEVEKIANDKVPTPVPLPPVGTTSEAEWEAWERAERKREEEDRVKMKVERWRGTVATVPSEGSAGSSRFSSSKPEASSSVPVPFLTNESTALEQINEDVEPEAEDVDLTGKNDNGTKIASLDTPKIMEPSISKEPALIVNDPNASLSLSSSNLIPKPAVQPSLTLTSEGDLLSNRAPLGFPVVKRGSKTADIGGKPKASTSGSGFGLGSNSASGFVRQNDSSMDKGLDAVEKGKEKAKGTELEDEVVKSPPSLKGKEKEVYTDLPHTSSSSKPPLKAQEPKTKTIADVSEMSFLPPSFPSSDLLTSTPKPATTSEGFAKQRQKQKPEPIVGPSADSSSAGGIGGIQSPQLHQPDSSNPFAPAPSLPSILVPSSSFAGSPGTTKAYGQSSSSALESSSSIPEMPSSPIQRRGKEPSRRPISSSSPVAVVKTPSRSKRPRSSDPGERKGEAKKARTDVTEAEGGEEAPPVTPKAGTEGKRKTPSALPTLTELLASSKKERKERRSRKSMEGKKVTSTPKEESKTAEKIPDGEQPPPKKMMNVTQMAGMFKPASVAATVVPAQAAPPAKKSKFRPAPPSALIPAPPIEQPAAKPKFKPASSSVPTLAPPSEQPAAKSKFRPASSFVPTPASPSERHVAKSRFKPAPSSAPDPLTPVPAATPTSPLAAPKSKFRPAPPSVPTPAPAPARVSSPLTAKASSLSKPVTTTKSIFPAPLSPRLIHENDIFAEVDDHHYIPNTDDPFSLESPSELFALTGIDYTTSSPTKSLSSLANSDSEDEGDELMSGHSSYVSGRRYKGLDGEVDSMDFSQSHEGFNPPFVSTQNGFPSGSDGNGGTGKFGWMGYSSQLSVDEQVNEVEKFMEKDVDYDGWLRDPSLEPEEA